MKKITEVLRLKYAGGLSHAQIGQACSISKGAVSKYVSLAAAHGLTWPLPADLDEAGLEGLLFPPAVKPAAFAEPDHFGLHQALKRKGVTLQLLWSEYAAVHGERAYRYSQFCHRYHQWRAMQKRSMRQHHRAGEKLFIDYAGPTVEVIDRSTGEVRQAQVFVAVLGASSYTYAEATWSQSLPDWIAAHQRALRFFGGVPQLLVPDNLRAAVTQACRYEPGINATYAEMAAHYGTAVLPALNERPFQRRTESRKDLFEQLDRPALKPLPQAEYVYAEWRKAKPGIDYHVEVDRRFYSVPHALVGQVLELRLTATTVEVLHKGQRVATHPRTGQGRFSTCTEHMPKSHQAHRDWSPGRFLRWAQDIGPCTAEVITRQLEGRPHPEHGYRACLGLLNLGRRYSRQRLEKACQRALAVRTVNYQSIASILKNGLDQQPLDTDRDEQRELPLHANVRGAGYYH